MYFLPCDGFVKRCLTSIQGANTCQRFQTGLNLSLVEVLLKEVLISSTKTKLLERNGSRKDVQLGGSYTIQLL